MTDNLFYFIHYIYAEPGHERLCKYNAFVFKEKLQCDQSYPKSKTKKHKYRPNVTSNMLDATSLCCNATFYLHVRDKYVAMHFIFLLTKLNNDNMQLN